jgi:cytochrome P450
MARIAPDRELVYDKWTIPAGTRVGMTMLLMHLDENLYPDPKKFDPERWMDMESRKEAVKTYAPFSRGTRICLGM